MITYLILDETISEPQKKCQECNDVEKDTKRYIGYTLEKKVCIHLCQPCCVYLRRNICI